MQNPRLTAVFLTGVVSFWVWNTGPAAVYDRLYTIAAAPRIPSLLWSTILPVSLWAAAGLMCGITGALIARAGLAQAWLALTAGWLVALVGGAFVLGSGVEIIAATLRDRGPYVYLVATVLACALVARARRRAA